MSLEEQIIPHARYWDCYNDEPEKYNHTGKILKIEDEYAIEFAEWLRGDYYSFEDGWMPFGKLKENNFTNKDLLEIYKKEQKL